MLPGARILAIAAVVSFCSNWQFGYQITYINTASRAFYQLADQVHQLQSGNSSSPFSSADQHLSWDQWSVHWSIIVSSFYAGALIGFILVPYLIRKVGGVRNALLVSSMPAVFGCVIQLGVRVCRTIVLMDILLFTGRLLVGIQAGCSLCLLPLFIIETSAFSYRPFLSSLQQVFQSLATLIGLVVGSNSLINMGERKLEWLQLIALSPTIFFVVFLIWLPETPFRVLERCRQPPEDLDKCSDDELELAFEHSSIFYYGSKANFSAIRDEAFQRWRIPDPAKRRHRPLADNFKGLLIGTLASISFTFTADDLIDSYSAEFYFRSSDSLEPASAERLTALLGLLLFLASVAGAFLVDRFGRRRLLITGLVGTALSNALASLGASMESAWLVTAGFAFTKAFIGFGAGAPAWFLTSELVSSLFVAQAQAISTGSLLVTTGLSTLSFLSLQVWLGSAGIALLLLSSGPALLVAILLFLLLPETMDLPFDRVHHLLALHPLPGLAAHPKWSRAILAPLLGENGGGEDGMPCWEKSWELPHRAQRLMSASSYVSYGSIHQQWQRSPSPLLYRRHSAHPSPSFGFGRTNQHDQPPQMENHLAPPQLDRCSTFTSAEFQ